MLQPLRTFFTKNPYRKEISLVIAAKLIGLFLLWWLCFSHPMDKQLTSQQVAQHLLAP